MSLQHDRLYLSQYGITSHGSQRIIQKWQKIRFQPPFWVKYDRTNNLYFEFHFDVARDRRVVYSNKPQPNRTY